MKIPRDWSGNELIKRPKKLGYEPTRQMGSHVRLTRSIDIAEHHITVPLHQTLRVGTLNNILNEIAVHLGKGKEDVLRALQ